MINGIKNNYINDYKMFLSLFCSRDYFYKTLIRTTYNEYVNVYLNLKQKHPQYKPFMLINDFDNLDDNIKEDIRIAQKKQDELSKELIDLVKIYCKNNPNKKICDYCHFKTYKEAPWRLHQHLKEFVDQLD